MPPRRTNAPVKKPPSRAPEDEALDTLIRQSHFEDYEFALMRVVDCAATYAAELKREDPAHKGRLSKRHNYLIDAVLKAAKAWENRGSTYDDPERRTWFRNMISDEEFAKAVRRVKTYRHIESLPPAEQHQAFMRALEDIKKRPRQSDE
jgi:hypothetical protein